MKLDIKQHVTDMIIEQIEAGTPPWQKPWTGDAAGMSLPLRHNGEPYRGINILVLWASAMRNTYQSARWMTYNQAKQLGGCVRKGEKGTRSVFYGSVEKKTEETQENSNGVAETRYFAKANTVFNADQIDDLPVHYYVRPEKPKNLGTQPVPVLDRQFALIGVDIITSDNPQAYYDPRKDHIHMPPIATFHSASKYYGTLAHEEIHASGHSKRLDRLKTFAGRADHAFEELVAEIGNAMICVTLGIEPEFDQNAAYIEGWLRAMKSDKDMIFKAAAEAQKAVDYILEQMNESGSFSTYSSFNGLLA